jgi:hypothetical protein
MGGNSVRLAAATLPSLKGAPSRQAHFMAARHLPCRWQQSWRSVRRRILCQQPSRLKWRGGLGRAPRPARVLQLLWPGERPAGHMIGARL